MTKNNNKYTIKKKVRNTVELWVTEVDEEGKIIRYVAEFLDETSAKEYLKMMNKEDDD